MIYDFNYYSLLLLLLLLYVQGLLDRDPAKRLGVGGGIEVQNHPFFNGLDWDLLYQRKITPPYNPCRDKDSVLDSDNFEEEFTSMPLQSVDDTSAAALALLNNRDSTKFCDFTYNKDSAFDDQDTYYDASEEKQYEGMTRPRSDNNKRK